MTTKSHSRPVCIKNTCYSPMACEAFGYCRELNLAPAEDLTPAGIQLVIPGAERVAPATQKQLDLF